MEQSRWVGPRAGLGLVAGLALGAALLGSSPARAAGTEAIAAPAAAFTGTEGFITTRPTCVPPRYTPDPLNYLQGAEPIRLATGDITLLVGAGRCCRGHWEGLFSLTYPQEGRAATPRFRPIWATNDFGAVRNRREAEMGFPSALVFGGKWRIAYTSTFLPFHKPNRDRIGRIDLPDLMTRATPAQVTNRWVEPIDPKCGAIASCPGTGSGLDSVLTQHPSIGRTQGELFLYHRDGNHPACASGYVRHRVGADLRVTSAQPDACVTFEGTESAPSFISDIARTRDGRLLLLAERFVGRSAIVEWSSEGGPAEIGRHWKPTGRRWLAPLHPKGSPWAYYVRDAAFLKDPRRNVVTPAVVVAQISDGPTYAEMADVRLGRWQLYWWADEDAELPPTFGGPASSCAYQGAVEGGSCTEVRGWAWDPMFPTSPISVEVLVDGVPMGTVAADRARPDLASAGKGDGRHGFVWEVPPSLRNGKPRRVTVRFAGTTDPLAGKRLTLRCK